MILLGLIFSVRKLEALSYHILQKKNLDFLDLNVKSYCLFNCASFDLNEGMKCLKFSTIDAFLSSAIYISWRYFFNISL